MKIAFVHDWLITYAGAERVLEQMLLVYPQADLFSLIDFLPDKERGFIQNKSVKTSFIQNLPFAKTKYRNYLALMPLAIEQLDLSAYNLVISSSHAIAKGVLTKNSHRLGERSSSIGNMIVCQLIIAGSSGKIASRIRTIELDASTSEILHFIADHKIMGASIRQFDGVPAQMFKSTVLNGTPASALQMDCPWHMSCRLGA